MDPRRLVGRSCGKRNVLADDSTQQTVRVGKALVEVKDLWVQHLPPAECQQLAGEGRRALGRLDDLIEMGSLWVGEIRLLSKEHAESHYGGQQIVEVVGNPAGELAHSFHLLGLTELFFRGSNG